MSSATKGIVMPELLAAELLAATLDAAVAPPQLSSPSSLDPIVGSLSLKNEPRSEEGPSRI
eukprot:4895136-Pyramimonas_sp.AAC.1